MQHVSPSIGARIGREWFLFGARKEIYLKSFNLLFLNNNCQEINNFLLKTVVLPASMLAQISYCFVDVVELTPVFWES